MSEFIELLPSDDCIYVEVTVEFLKLGEIDTLNEKFTAELAIESEWSTSEDISLYSDEKHWNPKIFIENCLQANEEKCNYRVSFENEQTIVRETKFIKGFVNNKPKLIYNKTNNLFNNFRCFWERLELQNVSNYRRCLNSI